MRMPKHIKKLVMGNKKDGVDEKMSKKTEKKDAVLALGEVSGHRHVLKQVHALKEENGLTTKAKIPQETELIHEEHDKQLVQEGEVEVRIQERVNVLGEIRKVMD